MARIRTLKPEFWADEKLSLLDPITRLVFLGLVSMADDAGRLIDNVKQLDGQLFPNTDDSCRDALDTLARMERIIRYQSASGQYLLQIANWSKHQRVDKPSAYVLPAPPPAPSSGDTRETLAGLSRSDLGPTTPDQGAGTTAPASRESGKSVSVIEASELFQRIRGLKQQQPGTSAVFIPPGAVEQLGADVARAFKALGGARAFLVDDMKEQSILAARFRTALSEARAAQ